MHCGCVMKELNQHTMHSNSVATAEFVKMVIHNLHVVFLFVCVFVFLQVKLHRALRVTV